LDGIKSDNVSIILKKEFVSAKISPSPVQKGQPFTITGFAEGDPGSVHIWIIGDNYQYDTTVAPSPDSAFTLNAGTEITENLPKGQCYLIVQHPMQNNQLDIVRNGDRVKNVQLNEGGSTGMTSIFKIWGAGSLQGIDAARALVAAFSESHVDDTYTEFPFSIDDTGISARQAQPIVAAPVQRQSQHSPLLYAPVGTIVLIIGIAAWRRR
jgi:trimeric autotransporter adhesin